MLQQNKVPQAQSLPQKRCRRFPETLSWQLFFLLCMRFSKVSLPVSCRKVKYRVKILVSPLPPNSMAVKNQEGEAGTIEIDESVPVTPELVREDVLLAERIKRHVHDA